jgi:hypothetical protein
MSTMSSIFVLPPAGHDFRRGASNLFVEGPVVQPLGPPAEEDEVFQFQKSRFDTTQNSDLRIF